MQDDFVEARSVLGNCLKEQGQLLEALDQFLKAISIDKKYVEAYSNAGSVYVSLGKYKEALDKYREAVKLDPDDPFFMYELAILEEEQAKDYARAIELWTKFLEYKDFVNDWDKVKEAENRLNELKKKV